MTDPNQQMMGSAPQSVGASMLDVPETLGVFTQSQFSAGYEDDLGFKALEKLLADDVRSEPVPQRAKMLFDADRLGIKLNNINVDSYDDDDLYTIIKRQARILQRDRIAARKPDGVLNSVLGFGAGFAGALVAPSSIATLPLTLVSPTVMGGILARAGASTAGRVAIRAGVEAAETGVLTAVQEPANYLLSQSLGDDYTGYNSFMNIAFGIGAGGLFGTGRGILSEHFGNGMDQLSIRDRSEILQSGAYKMARDGDVDIEPLINAQLKTRLLYDLNTIRTDPELKRLVQNGTPQLIPDVRASKELFDTNADYRARITDLEQKVKYSGKNKYERALNDYNEANSLDPQSPKDIALKARSIETLEKRYGSGFKEEADDYSVYVKKREQIDSTTDKRKLKTLEREVAALDAKHGGRLSDAYTIKRNKSVDAEAELQAARVELENYIGSRQFDKTMARINLENKARSELQTAKKQFAETPSTKVRDVVAKNVADIEARSKVLEQELDVDADIEAMDLMVQEFEQRTGVSMAENVDVEEFQPKSVVSDMMKYISCRLA